MNKEMMIEILMNDHCTRNEAIKHLNNGSIIFESKEEYLKSFNEEDYEICGVNADDLTPVEYQGHTYYVEYIL